jgi:hypothetical protein
MRVWAAVVLSLFLLLPMLVLGPAAPQAPPESVAAPADDPGQALPAARVEPDFRDAVYGDLLVVGNSVSRCPTPDEDPTAAACDAATGGSGEGNNNAFPMRLSATADSFAASSAELTIPAGAHVRYARLVWGGHTGTFLGLSGMNCVRPLGTPSQAPPAPAAARPEQQDVRIAVAGGAAHTVPREPAHFRRTEGLLEPSQIYTDWADVTDRFAGAPAGTPIQVDVRDVWAPSGPGCAGGWSLVVVYDHGGPTADHPTPRVVDLYSGALPQSGALVPGLLEALVPGFPSAVDALLPGLLPDPHATHVRLAGASRARGDMTLAVTAFDGDWRQGDETFTVDGTPVEEPCGHDGTADFFRSCATGAPAANNMSVDAKTVRVTLPPNDTGDIDVGVDGTGDFVAVANMAVSEPVDPGIAVTVTGPATPVRDGDLVELAVAVTNTGSLPLDDLALTATGEEMRCAPTVFAPLEPGGTANATCVVTAHSGTVTHEVTATGTYLVSNDGESRTVSATASDDTPVLPAEFTVSRVPDRLTVHTGEPVVFTVTLANNTGGDLTAVTYTDSATTQCEMPPAVLAAHTTATLRCTVAAVDATFTSEGTLTGVDPGGVPVTVHSQSVTVAVIAPSLTVTQTVAPDTVYRGTTTEAAFTVTNTGGQDDGPLLGVLVRTDLPGCAPPPLPALGPGESATLTCIATPVDTTDVTTTAEATDSAGSPLPATASPVTVTVLAPLLAIHQTATPDNVRTSAPVEFTFTVAHTGTAADGPLHQVRITSPTLPPSCVLDEIAELSPGQSESRTCTVSPDRSFTNAASAAALDQTNRPMTVQAEPLPVTVRNPALTVSLTATPDQAQHDANVDFEVTVHNTGDTPLSITATNDRAPDCDLNLPNLQAGTAEGVRCTIRTPADESTDELVNTVTWTAHPFPTPDDASLTGTESASVALRSGQAPEDPNPGVDPADGASAPGTDAGSPSRGDSASDADAGSAKNGDPNLAYTGAFVIAPLMIGTALVILGVMAVLGTRRRRAAGNGGTI